METNWEKTLLRRITWYRWRRRLLRLSYYGIVLMVVTALLYMWVSALI